MLLVSCFVVFVIGGVLWVLYLGLFVLCCLFAFCFMVGVLYLVLFVVWVVCCTVFVWCGMAFVSVVVGVFSLVVI